jgi:hypothetical protein
MAVKPAKSGPTWKPPAPYGHQGAIDSAGTTAAPLLAGFTITLTGLVINRSVQLRWPNLALLLLASAVVCLLAAVQCAYSARQYVVTPTELEAWWPNHGEQDVWEYIRRVQFGHAALFAKWDLRFRATYHAGVLLVLVAITIILLPPGRVPTARAAAVAVAGLGALLEGFWIAVVYAAGHYQRRDPERTLIGRLRRLIDIIEPPTLPKIPRDLEEHQPEHKPESNGDRIDGRRRALRMTALAVASIGLTIGLTFTIKATFSAGRSPPVPSKQGPTGPSGATGPRGVAGPSGPTGAAGRGLRGGRGPRGYRGPPGTEDQP